MVECIIFDLDDTLYDYKVLNDLAWTLVFEGVSNKIGISNEDVKEAFEYGRKRIKNLLPNCAAMHNRLLYIQSMFERLGQNPVEYSLEFYEIYWNYFLQNMKLRQGVLELLKKLMAKKIRIGICTDLTAHIQHRKIMALGLVPYVNFLVTSEEAGCEKPHRRIFELCLEKSMLQPGRILFIGDSFEKDVKGAKNNGMKSFWYDTSKYNTFVEFGSKIMKEIEI